MSKAIHVKQGTSAASQTLAQLWPESERGIEREKERERGIKNVHLRYTFSDSGNERKDERETRREAKGSRFTGGLSPGCLLPCTQTGCDAGKSVT